MRNIYTLIYALLITTGLAAQKYSKAIITDVNYLRRTSTSVDGYSFPFYFNNKILVKEIHETIKEQARKKFKINEVEFLSPDAIKYVDDIFSPALNVRDKALKDNEKGTIYIAVETIMQENVVINNVVNYKLTTRVKAYNYKGRKVYKFKNNIPFITTVGDEITGRVEMGEKDFFTFYMDGIAEAFRGKDKKTKKRFINKPPTSHYDDFISETEKFYLVPTNKGYAYGKDLNNLQDVIGFSGNFWHTSRSEFDIKKLFKGNTVNEGYNLSNFFQKQDYLVKLKGGENTFLNFLTVSSDVEIEFRKNRKEFVGYFTYDSSDLLEGQFNNEKYLVKWVPEFNCAEVFCNREKIIVINELPDRKVAYIHKSLNENQLGDLFNVMFAYDFAAAIYEKLDAMSSNDYVD